ncbi:Hint domain-containing protein [Phaeovulum vinaykumarii]|uniref:Hint domain-containing protein n=2 Tax=Phaeovulum vinaykumarii TaxID=407234 RepID=A0A1N7MF96_9RHOB|nr:Hint domain-containing protein [Phaeovulum vinaykumarii]SOC11936.1 Hint domain-containing protein [Phaeovulum vinaykumarii]
MTDDGFGRTFDLIDVSALTDANGNPVNAWDVNVTNDGSGNALLTFPNGETLTLIGIPHTSVSSAKPLYSMGIPCFVAGTRIDTPTGPRPVEDLRAGDLVRVRDGAALPVLWAGQSLAGRAALDADPRMRAIEIRAGALGSGAGLGAALRDGAPCPARPLAPHGPLAPHHLPATRDRPGDAPPERLVRAGHLAATGWGGRAPPARPAARCLPPPSAAAPRAGLRRGLWLESLWPGPMALAAQDRAGQLALLAARSDLFAALTGMVAVERLYSPRVRPLLPRRAVTRAACRDWSRQAGAFACADAADTAGDQPPKVSAFIRR